MNINVLRAGLLICTMLVGSLFFVSCEEEDDLNSSPVVKITSHESGAILSNAESIEFACTATDAEDGNIDGSSIQWKSDKDGVLGSGNKISVEALSLSKHIIEVQVVDSYGNMASDTITLTIADGISPEILIEDFGSNNEFSYGEAVTLSCKATDESEGNLGGNSIVWKSDIDGDLGVGNEITVSDLSINSHQIIAIATDNNGNSGSDTISVKIKDTNNPMVNIIGIESNEMFDFESEITFTCTAFDNEDGDLTGDAVVWTSDIDGEFGKGVSLKTASLTIGLHEIVATATDKSNNSGGDTVLIEIVKKKGDLEILMSRMTGSFSSKEQSETSADPYHFNFLQQKKEPDKISLLTQQHYFDASLQYIISSIV